ncbi:hypothetical protein [Halobellus sp. Atlit-38R]|uniref:hypothetical protein n=1 Tax=Halobellus sp. Atlit-38R TaxID=2282131 RepID=UPI001F2B6D7A|nr:hypothetical protein [Halobellus sp. Atlit-38R]
MREQFTEIDEVSVAKAIERPVDHSGRVLIVDDRVVLLSARPLDSEGEETAIWSADTAMAKILSRAIESSIDPFIEGTFSEEQRSARGDAHSPARE